jgi:photosystem II stability/assembly factor-like uncharacterized protein
MSQSDKSEERRKRSANGGPPEDDPLLRSKDSNIDKKIGNMDNLLAEKRLAAIKRAREMSSSESEDTDSELSTSSSNGPVDLTSDTNNWVQLGPTSHPNGQTYSPARVEVSGRITAIIIHPEDPNTIYVGAAQGGVWKTSDGGNTWIPTSDDADSLAIGALAIDPINPLVLYAGTGEANFSGDSQYGLGIIKTIDGGKTWKPQGQDKSSIIRAPENMSGFLNSRFSRIAINSENSTTIFVATVSSRNPNVASGIYRSINGGEKWMRMENNLPPISTVGATDIILDPANSSVAYAAFYGEGVYKTTNANDDNPRWEKMTVGLPSSDFTRIVLSISKSSPNTIYALMANSRYVIDKFFQSTDGGGSWSRINLPNGDIGGQGFYNINLAVNPRDENIVYLSGVSLWKAIRSPGNNNWIFADIGKRIHPDNHSLAFNPENPEVIYAGNDGGIYQSNNGGETWIATMNKGLCITQFEFMEQHPTSDKIILAGTQDNGTLRYNDSPTFHHADDGDGGFTCIDPKDPKNMWHAYYGLSPAFSAQGGEFGSWRDLGGPIFGDPSNFYAPLTLDKTNPNNIAIGGEILYLDHSKGKDGWPDRVDLNLPAGDLISAINYLNSNLIYVGTNGGRIYRLTKSANNWTTKAIHADPFPIDRYIWDIATLPNDETKLIVIVSGFGTGHVFRGDILSDGQTRWTDISGTGNGKLPDIPVNALVIDENISDNMYIGTDAGVFRSMDGGKNWINFSIGSKLLPNCQVYDMRLYSPDHLRIVTHGRGMWRRKLRAR